MSRRAKETLAVQLFPFLAVLVCTMGSLIFLLLVTTRQIRVRAVAYAAYELAEKEKAEREAAALAAQAIPIPKPIEAPVAPPVAIPKPVVRISKPVKQRDPSYDLALAERELELAELKAKWKNKARELAKDRDNQNENLVRQKSLVDNALERTSAIESEVGSLEEQLKKLASDAAAALSQVTDEAERRLLEQQIAELKKRLRAAQAKESLADASKFQVVPFDPQTGTTRRPILIECTGAGIRFLPEDITITPAELNGFIPKINPVAVGTAALINYWNNYNSKQANPQGEPEPYVLLLVRPDGVIAYYVAMKMLEPIRTQHGYELIDESTTLQLPDVDPQAKAACEAAIHRLMAERDQIYRSAVSGGAGGTVFGGSPHGTNGPGGKPGSESARSPGSGGQRVADATGSANGGGNGFSMSDINGSEDSVGARSWERVENFEGRPRKGKPGELDSGISEKSAGAGSSSADGNSGGRESVFGMTPLPGETASSSRQQGHRKNAGTSDGSEMANGENASGGDAGDGRSTDGSSGNQGPSGGQASGGSPSSGSQRGSRGMAGKPARWSSDNKTSPNSFEGAAEPEPNMPIGKRPGRKAGKSKFSSGDSANGSDSADQNDTDSQANSQPNGQAGDQSGLSDNSPSGRNPNGNLLSSSSTKSRHKPKKSADDANKQLEPEMLAGRRWGYSDDGATIGFEREVRVDVLPDKFVIAEKYEVPVEQGESREDTLEHFATSLDRFSHEWGRPPQGFFWTPRLKFVVKPEANSQYERINALMTRAGVATSHEFADTSNALQYGRESRWTKQSASKDANKTSTGGTR